MIPINDLQRIDEVLQTKLGNALNACLARSWYLLGPETQAFEQEFAQYCGTTHCIGLANGTDAIELALRALQVAPGDEVATVANAGMYSTIAIKNVSATPLYIEINAKDANMDPADLRKRLHKNTKAIIATHLYGQLCAINEIIQIANEWQIPVIEDCAQAHGAMQNGHKAGSFGSIGCFSFYPTKNLGALGDAGAIVTNSATLATRIVQLRQYGWGPKYHCSIPGGRNSRMDELQAAVLRAKLHYLDDWNARRREIAQEYCYAFRGLTAIEVPTTIDESYVAHLYVIKTPKREALRQHLATLNIATEIHYPIPDYLQPCAKNDHHFHLSITEKSCNEVLTLPCFPFLKQGEITSVIKGVKQSLQME
jgi:dTDP-3-amino-2,3,6-trideoxy-4-keto-D-glucose/dTDP-3-amino-3,4,6-trideoxy-alpha-D-glucose/dTDP-2,6-dideoxy-D-kanosamine transaminase